MADQLMARSIQLKQPELEEKRLHLLQNEGQLGKQKLELQDKLLVELSSATGDLLKNEVIVMWMLSYCIVCVTIVSNFVATSENVK